MTIYNDTMSDGVLLDGTSLVSKETSLEASGGVLANGIFNFYLIFDKTSADGISLDGSILLIQEFSNDQLITYATDAQFDFDISFVWTTGIVAQYWYVVEGYVWPPDDTQCLDITVQERQNFIQTILATNVSDLCSQFSRQDLNWEIVNIKRYARPADFTLPRPDSYCNNLTKLVSATCPEFSVSVRALTKIGAHSVAMTVLKYSGSGTAKLSGNADTIISSGASTPVVGSYLYDPSFDPIYTGGSVEASSSWNAILLTYAGVSATLSQEQIIFGTGVSASDLVAPKNTIATACGSCIAFPLNLYIEHNINNQSVFYNFIQRNGLTLPISVLVSYNAKLGIWVGHQHFTGLSDDNINQENWRFTFEWSCLSEYGGEEIGTPNLKFAISVIKKNTGTAVNIESRIVVLFPSDEVCNLVRNFKDSLSFSLNTKTNFIYNSNGITANSVFLNDKIGLFNSLYWTNNPGLNIRISSSGLSTKVEMKDISSIFPAPDTFYQQGQVFSNSNTLVK